MKNRIDTTERDAKSPWVGTKTGRDPKGMPALVPGTARERILKLFDAGTFFEIDAGVRHRCQSFNLGEKRIPGDGVICGFGRIDGKTVYAYSQDRSVLGGSLGEAHAKKIVKIMDLAGNAACPIVAIHDGGGARIQEGVEALAGYGKIFQRNVRYSGRVPQIALLMGACAGGAAYSPALSDFVIMIEGQSFMFVTGEKVVKAVTGEEIDRESLGGARVHAETSGVAHFLAKSEGEGLQIARQLLSYLTPIGHDAFAAGSAGDTESTPGDGLSKVVPTQSTQPYEVRDVIRLVLDRGSFLEVHAGWAQNIRVGLGRLGGRSVGIVANNPAKCAGVLDINASRKAARFVRTCNAFGLPIISFVDVPGFMPGTRQEHGGIIDHGAKLAFAFCEATVPKLTVILRKAYGGGYIVMGSKHVGADFNFSWPNAQIAVVGAAAAVEVLYAKHLANGSDTATARANLAADYQAQHVNPTLAEARGFLDAVIDPRDTRRVLCGALTAIRTKRLASTEQRGNIPL